jgi:simple sugar transport system substrate-binding protein
MIKLAPLNPAVPKDVADMVTAAEKDIVAGKLHPFQGPVVDNAGKERMPKGKTMSDDELQKMDFYVAGVQGSLPKK